VADCCNWCNAWRNNTPLELWAREIQALIDEHRTKLLYTRKELMTMLENINALIVYIRNNKGKMSKKTLGLI
jgi:hypothetical protein